MIKEINSNSNPIIKNCMLLKNKKGITEQNSCFVESEKVVLDLLNTELTPKKIFITESKTEKFKSITQKYNNIVYIISDAVANRLSDTVTTSGVFAEFELPKQKSFDFSKKFLVLDNLQDPSNLGAIIRSAIAFGFNQIILVGGVYPYLPKVIRSSMSYVFQINFMFVTVEELEGFKIKNNFKLISANLNGTHIDKFKIINNFGLVIGNEGNGVCEKLQNLCDYTVTIPMNKNIESLNASISASIIMYLLR